MPLQLLGSQLLDVSQNIDKKYKSAVVGELPSPPFHLVWVENEYSRCKRPCSNFISAQVCEGEGTAVDCK